MKKERYVEKMTDLVEDQLLDMGVSPYFTIEDGWEENEELSMRLYHDVNEHEINFDLSELYAQKKEEDIKIKTQFAEYIKQDVVSFVEREKALGLDGRRYEAEEEEEEDFDDLDEDVEEEPDIEGEEDDYDDEEEEEDEDYEDDEYDDEDEEDELGEESESKSNFSSKLSNVFAPLKFEDVEGTNGSAKSATLPQSFDGDIEKVSKRYGNQLAGAFEDGCFLSKPSKQDVLVFDASVFDRSDVEGIVSELLEEGGESKVKEVEPLDKESTKDR